MNLLSEDLVLIKVTTRFQSLISIWNVCCRKFPVGCVTWLYPGRNWYYPYLPTKNFLSRHSNFACTRSRHAQPLWPSGYIRRWLKVEARKPQVVYYSICACLNKPFPLQQHIILTECVLYDASRSLLPRDCVLYSKHWTLLLVSADLLHQLPKFFYYTMRHPYTPLKRLDARVHPVFVFYFLSIWSSYCLMLELCPHITW